ncbi:MULTISPECIES: DUF2970 domain-containing protein [Halomonadaceae]|uniref:DUF2970 domain-containing protein n=1 Tax=Halomonadaceae TaxID=28256 RepID=UPI0015976F28|nr:MULTISPECIES: DUF2970 domain-containing protein [Halomonas]QJQ96726.1 DUF2970 domain-containing protein [Halomonas sp. PA5]
MWSVVKSVLAAFFGVQKESQRRHDFEHGKPMHFIIMGLVMGLVLVILVAGVAMLAAR